MPVGPQILVHDHADRFEPHGPLVPGSHFFPRPGRVLAQARPGEGRSRGAGRGRDRFLKPFTGVDVPRLLPVGIAEKGVDEGREPPTGGNRLLHFLQIRIDLQRPRFRLDQVVFPDPVILRLRPGSGPDRFGPGGEARNLWRLRLRAGGRAEELGVGRREGAGAVGGAGGGAEEDQVVVQFLKKLLPFLRRRFLDSLLLLHPFLDLSIAAATLPAGILLLVAADTAGALDAAAAVDGAVDFVEESGGE